MRCYCCLVLAVHVYCTDGRTLAVIIGAGTCIVCFQGIGLNLSSLKGGNYLVWLRSRCCNPQAGGILQGIYSCYIEICTDMEQPLSFSSACMISSLCKACARNDCMDPTGCLHFAAAIQYLSVGTASLFDSTLLLVYRRVEISQRLLWNDLDMD